MRFKPNQSKGCPGFLCSSHLCSLCTCSGFKHSEGQKETPESHRVSRTVCAWETKALEGKVDLDGKVHHQRLIPVPLLASLFRFIGAGWKSPRFLEWVLRLAAAQEESRVCLWLVAGLYQPSGFHYLFWFWFFFFLLASLFITKRFYGNLLMEGLS